MVATHRPSGRFLEEAGVPCAPINTVPAMMAVSLNVACCNMTLTSEDPATGPLKVAGNPIKIVGAEEATSVHPAPNLDADRADILELLNNSRTRETVHP